MVFERLGSKAAAAAELGFNPRTAARWGRVKGVGGRAPHPGPDEYSKLRASGVHRAEAARRIGVNSRTAQDWDLGIRHVSNKRIRPDGRVIDYTSGMATLLPAVPAALEQPINARYLSLSERETIRDMLASGSSLRTISAALRRARLRPCEWCGFPLLSVASST
ncbi:helix-turn-helix domain-containing protein [Cryobacterium sp. TMT2-42-4]|nr:helix-turn-helix domain-containing protein [Cryobacterium sp. TMT2-42-4]TFC35590.1 helix-turn-helix domain-containing protein [Cryobacterium sp. TMT2-42-4]